MNDGTGVRRVKAASAVRQPPARQAAVAGRGGNDAWLA